MRRLARLTIVLLAASLGACASAPVEQHPASAQSELTRAYMATLDRQARQGFTSIHWVHPPTQAQVSQKVDRTERDD